MVMLPNSDFVGSMSSCLPYFQSKYLRLTSRVDFPGGGGFSRVCEEALDSVYEIIIDKLRKFSLPALMEAGRLLKLLVSQFWEREQIVVLDRIKSQNQSNIIWIPSEFNPFANYFFLSAVDLSQDQSANTNDTKLWLCLRINDDIFQIITYIPGQLETKL